MRWTRRRVALTVACAAVLFAPGWRARLVPTDHEELLAASRAASAARVFGVSLPHAEGAERWHAQYVDSSLAVVFHDLGMGGALPRLVAPAFAAHLPAGAERADGYFRVRTEVHWPWWRPGGGVAWRSPAELPGADARESEAPR